MVEPVQFDARGGQDHIDVLLGNVLEHAQIHAAPVEASIATFRARAEDNDQALIKVNIRRASSKRMSPTAKALLRDDIAPRIDFDTA